MDTLKPLLSRVKNGFNRYRVALLVFLIIYAAFLLLNLSKAAIQWDEITHLNGGSFLFRGEYQTYMTLNSFYPPMFDLITMVFFRILGISVFSGRLVAVVFSLLTIWVVFEFTYKMFNEKVALLSSVLFGVMPGFFWLSRMAMIETMLVFFFTLSLMCFFMWLKNHKNRWLVFAGVALGLGFLTKYQMIAAGVVMLVSMLFLAKNKLKIHLNKITILAVAVILVVVPWILIAYQTYASNMLEQWIYAMQMGNPEKSVYSIRFSVPVSYTVFYFIEMVWPYPNIHPVSLLLYAVGLAGLGFLAWRRKPEDKYLLIWFIVVFVFFTLIPNKQWRYVVPLFPVMAIATSNLIVYAYEKMQKTLKSNVTIKKKNMTKVGAVLLTAFLAAGLFFSVNDAHSWVSNDEIVMPIDEVANYAANHMTGNQSIMLVCPFNLFSQDMFRFYLWANSSHRNMNAYQYPELPVDTYQIDFNATEFVCLCEELNVKYIVLYDYGANTPFYNTTTTISNVTTMIYETQRFGDPQDQPFFGVMPHRMFLVPFNKNQTQTGS
ncbi:MAG: ArnT family glycosyltransferase [Candidatus Bathyarchaeia archaeon]|jgi:4-amino-4-deoxy-L-arabinose transferase-like glycosyltransferase